jgi:hypothetical protein
MFDLALRLGKTVGELERELTPTELSYWIAYNEISPISDHRMDLLFALLTSEVHNGFNKMLVQMAKLWASKTTARSINYTARDIDDFVLAYDMADQERKRADDEQRQTERLLEKVKMINSMMGGTVEPKQR